MTEISGIYPLVRIEAAGVREPLLEYTVFDTVKDFFRDAEIWRYSVPTTLNWTTALPFPALTAGVELPAGTRLHRVDMLKYGSDGQSFRRIHFYTKQQLDDVYSDWETKTGSTPLAYTNDPTGDAPRIIPTATADVNSSLRVRVILVPDTLTDVPDFLYAEFHDAWRWGALARLLKMPEKDWTNLTLAAFYEKKYDDEVIRAKSRVQSEYGQPVNRTTAYGGL